MVEVETLKVEIRNTLGKRNNRRLRKDGKIPAVLYGHKQENVSLAVPADNLAAVIRHGNRFVQLGGALREKALIKECQWDTWGQNVLHLDLARVGEHEKIKVHVALELRGDAPGVKEGGVVKHHIHSVEMECEAASVPEKIEVNINHLELNHAIHINELEIPAGSTIFEEPAAVVVSCDPAVEISDEDLEAKADGEQPEVISRKKEEKSEE
ncbi:MAG: 50S ribosomal protein L25 [Planctomycetaceae bacterium]|jgi:large subunit ribosomal protein L25|nr:50S ribosomal protein L25 [Planctomycetaceae bacterium]